MSVYRLLPSGDLKLPPKKGLDMDGVMHSDLQQFYDNNLDQAARAGYYPVVRTTKPEETNGVYYKSHFELQDGVLLQVWSVLYPGEPGHPLYPPKTQSELNDELHDMEMRNMYAKIDYVAMTTGTDFTEMYGIITEPEV